MSRHLDVFLALVAIVGFGHANDLFGQTMQQQQQQQNLGGIGRSFPSGLDGAFHGGPPGRPRESSGPNFGIGRGGFGGVGAPGSTGRNPEGVFGSANGGGMPTPGLGGSFNDGRVGGPLSPGGRLPAGGGSGPGIFGDSSTPSVGGSIPAGPIGGSGSRGVRGLPGLEGGAPSPSDTLSGVGSGLSSSGGMGRPPVAPGTRGPGQRDAGPGQLGAPSGPFGGSRGSPGSLGFTAGPSGTGGGALGSFGRPEEVAPGSGSFGNPSASATGGFGSGTGESSPFGPPASAPGATGTGGSLFRQREQGNNLPSPVGGGVGPGYSGSWAPQPGGPSSSGSTGVSGAGVNGAGARGPTATGAQGSGVGIGGRPISGSGPSGARPGRKPRKELTQTEKAAIGLGVTGGVFALTALGAAIASAVQTAHQRKPGHGKPGGGAGTGCLKPPCTSGCGRQRRSIQESKVTAEVLNSIPTDFERLY